MDQSEGSGATTIGTQPESPVTIVLARTVKPGHQDEYRRWLTRLLEERVFTTVFQSAAIGCGHSALALCSWRMRTQSGANEDRSNIIRTRTAAEKEGSDDPPLANGFSRSVDASYWGPDRPESRPRWSRAAPEEALLTDRGRPNLRIGRRPPTLSARGSRLL